MLHHFYTVQDEVREVRQDLEKIALPLYLDFAELEVVISQIVNNNNSYLVQKLDGTVEDVFVRWLVAFLLLLAVDELINDLNEILDLGKVFYRVVVVGESKHIYVVFEFLLQQQNYLLEAPDEK